MSGGSELHSLSLFDSSPLGFAVMDATTAALDSSFMPAISTGYLEDALVDYNPKRRRLGHHLVEFEFPQRYWSSFCTWGGDALESFDWNNNQIDDMNNFTEEGISTSPKNRVLKTPPEIEPFSTPNSSAGSGSERKKRKKRKVVYPFALVKPGGVEGDITLNDINKKMLMPPTRAVRHPVGDFACRPYVTAEGRGLSGKAVVALTKIHTQGRRGSITIIRTKG
ncbi:protein XRI1-like [Cucurbita moschata]|uniref:Protein XRI1-like n=1 Tax=Cucurbita moschata TaxID=3662 RepID=A0A6J1FFR7_CUCMO|nr:protein XRI1-like [Cucurbita moschata]